MESVRIAGHPIHPMLIPFPIALWTFSLGCDFIYLFEFGGPVWKDIALYTMVTGVAGGLLAAIPGFLDYRTLTEPRTVRLAQWHMAINVTIIVLYSINTWLRAGSGPNAVMPVMLSLLGVSLLGISGWLGGELVYVHGVGVEESQRAA